MDTKLTLSIDKQVIEEAKKYAGKRKVSLSGLIENYLASLTASKVEEPEITPLVKSLSGVINLPESFDSRESYTDFLIEKYK